MSKTALSAHRSGSKTVLREQNRPLRSPQAPELSATTSNTTTLGRGLDPDHSKPGYYLSIEGIIPIFVLAETIINS